jgi:penicillin-binding protein 2
MFEENNTKFIRRMLFLGILQIIIILVLLGRMYYLQVSEGAKYHLLAEGNRIATRPLLPLRGHIYDRNGILIAQNETNFRVVFLTDKKSEVRTTLKELSQLISLSPEEKQDVLEQVRKKRGLDAVTIKDNLTWEEVSAIELHASDLPGVSIEVGSIRQYPQKGAGAHLLGYVGSPSEKEQNADSMLAIPGLKVGKVGIEKYFDAHLRGYPGQSAFEMNAKRKVVRELDQHPSTSGKDIYLTLDSRLQDYAQHVLSAHESAAAVVMDIHKGDILALVSTPSFDPNLFPQGISHKDWNALQENPHFPLTNKALSGLYAPGSTVKLFVALAALELGLIDKNTTVYCPGHIYVGNHKFHCMHHHGHVNVSRAIAESCDVFFYEISKKIGIDNLSAFFQKMGLGEGGLEGFPHLKHGLVPTKAWKKEKKKANWTISDTIQTSIGQGYTNATPLELAVAMARLASGGKKVIPRLSGHMPVSFPSLELNQKHLKTILEAAENVVNAPNGTAYRHRIMLPGREMAGKTGTSQVRRITMKQRQAGLTKTYHLPREYREHGLFIGYAPLDTPKYAIAVVVAHTGSSGPAVQAARDILQYAQSLERSEILKSE